MKEAHIVNQEDEQIVSKMDSIVKIARDTTQLGFKEYSSVFSGLCTDPQGVNCMTIFCTSELPNKSQGKFL